MRAMIEITTEYNQQCTRMGDLMIQRENLTKQMNTIMQRIGQLQDEANARELFESEKAKEEEDKKKASTTEEETKEAVSVDPELSGT